MLSTHACRNSSFWLIQDHLRTTLGERSKKKLRKFGHMSKLGVPYLPSFLPNYWVWHYYSAQAFIPYYAKIFSIVQPEFHVFCKTQFGPRSKDLDKKDGTKQHKIFRHKLTLALNLPFAAQTGPAWLTSLMVQFDKLDRKAGWAIKSDQRYGPAGPTNSLLLGLRHVFILIDWPSS